MTNRASPAEASLIGDWLSPSGEPVVRLHVGDADSENMYAWFNAGYNLGNTTELYAFGGISNRDGGSSGFFRGRAYQRTIEPIYPDGGIYGETPTEAFDGELVFEQTTCLTLTQMSGVTKALHFRMRA